MSQYLNFPMHCLRPQLSSISEARLHPEPLLAKHTSLRSEERGAGQRGSRYGTDQSGRTEGELCDPGGQAEAAAVKTVGPEAETGK